MEIFLEISHGAHTLCLTVTIMRLMALLKVNLLVHFCVTILYAFQRSTTHFINKTILSDVFLTGRRYRGERAYNFWEVYLPNLVEQVNAVNSTMIRKN